jgi:hypothetical protein
MHGIEIHTFHSLGCNLPRFSFDFKLIFCQVNYIDSSGHSSFLARRCASIISSFVAAVGHNNNRYDQANSEHELNSFIPQTKEEEKSKALMD